MKRLRILFTLAAIFIAGVGLASVTPQTLRCEYLVNPLGIDATSPRLTWILTASQRGEAQTAYQILVASSRELLDADKGDLWDSGKVISSESSQIAYAGQPLVARANCFWKVRAWDKDATDAQPGAWSSVATWQMGLLQPEDWSAKWIESASATTAGPPAELVIQHATYEAETDGEPKMADVTRAVRRRVKNGWIRMPVSNRSMGVDPANNLHKHLRVEYTYNGQSFTNVIAEGLIFQVPEQGAALPYLRKQFDVNARVQSATLYVTALGLYEVHLNGQRVGDHVLAPDWTDYRHRVRYQAYDVTSLMQRGKNALAAMLADGWYSGHIGNGGFEFFGKEPAFMAQLEVTYADGRRERFVTDKTWLSHPSPILASDFMLGERYDARDEIKGWDQAGLDESEWQPVAVRTNVTIQLDAQVMPPVHELVELKPKSVKPAKDGGWIYDLGQNMVGVVRLKVSAPAGTKLTLHHAEMLNPDGSIYTTNLRGAPSVDNYTTKGGGTEIWQPRFTFHGFRYVELSGLSKPASLDMVTGVVIGSDTPRTGEFACSDPRLNQLQSNIQWGQRGNYISVPTDCPQRDERLGWMGDAEVFIRTATYNADVASFFTKWLVDVDDGQNAAGSFSDVSPNTMGVNGVPAWGDAGVICPWTIYEIYGDKRILKNHLPAMIRWIEYMHVHSDGLIRDRDRGNDYGDWLSIGADTPKDLIGTAFFAYSTHLVAKACRVVGHTADADKYDQLFADIKSAFNKKYVAADGRITGDTQCVYAMALKFELLPDELRPRAAQYLEDDIKTKGWHLSTGFVGVSYLLPVLTQAGKADTAYRLLLQDTFPSWLFSVKQGATTIWERWDGWTPDKGFQDPGMNSFNHYSLGSCGEFLFGGVGGIKPASAGYDTIAIKPIIEPGLTWAKTSYDSIHGKIATDWKVDGQKLKLKVTIPVNTSATVYVPAKDSDAVTESGDPVAKMDGVKFLRMENGRAVFELGSGTYAFNSVMP
ncbi:MAG TPA: family 78 glycoside hydrolase catalytic domain [Verrucomicrobiae bacterium]|jgi:alpha-L-rhamnosidase